VRRIWITGAKGLVGSALSEIAPKPLALSGHEVDIADLDACRAFVKQHGPITNILNCAAFSPVDPAETAREEAFRANALGPETLGCLAKEIGAHLLHISTDYVFPGTGNIPLKETDPVAPLQLLRLHQTRRGEEAYCRQSQCLHLAHLVGLWQRRQEFCCEVAGAFADKRRASTR